MSEYQYIEFRALDRCVSKANLQYIRRQSTRARITPWSFTNEYHFGDFRGDAIEMLRRGYDIHLHYANFGIRKLAIRLPEGFPNIKAARLYFEDDSLDWVKDNRGKGGALVIDPCYEPGDLEELWDLEHVLDWVAPLRSEIMAGDLRPLYIAYWAMVHDRNHDPEANVRPAPVSMRRPTAAQSALAEFYEINPKDAAKAAGRIENKPKKLPSTSRRP
jgi:hypothetical protein